MLLGVEMDHMLGSKWQFICRLGFSISPEEVTGYKQSIVIYKNVRDIIKSVIQGYFSQWSGDNVDHNVSLNGKGLLHGIGVVLLSTSLNDNEARKLPSLPAIPGQKLKKAWDVVQGKGIPVLQCEIPEEAGLSKLMSKKKKKKIMELHYNRCSPKIYI